MVLAPLPVAFFARPTVLVARALVGQLLVANPLGDKDGHVYRIVETEAYTQNDPACHAFGRTAATAKGRAVQLFQRPGLAYVYFIYGMHHCLNVVTEPQGMAGAVLFRGLEPLDVAVELVSTRATAGPGKLCKTLGITTQAHNGLDLTLPGSPYYLASPASNLAIAGAQVIATTRIGINKAQTNPWRFLVDGNPWVSVRA
jgi:DNA-3-methyladenine glycosylase